MASPASNYDEKHMARGGTEAAYSSSKYYNKASGNRDKSRSSGSKKVFNPLLMNSQNEEPKDTPERARSVDQNIHVPKNGQEAAENPRNDVQLHDNYSRFPQHTNTDSSNHYHGTNHSPRTPNDSRSSYGYSSNSYQQFRDRKSSEYNQRSHWKQSNYNNNRYSADGNQGYTNENEATENEYLPSPNNYYKNSVAVKRPNIDYDYDYATVEGISRQMIFDTHCHLDRIFDQWNKDKIGLTADKWRGTNNPPDCQPIGHLKAQEQFKDAFGSKFEGCISVCCDPPTWNKTWYEWLIKENNVWLTYGCHPAKAALFDDTAETTLQMLLSFPKVVALGEIGLDETYYGRQGATQEVQIDAFKRQVEIARRMNKSLVIHLRGEVQDLARQLLADSGLHSEWKIHMHCFNQKLQVAEDWLQDWPNMKFGVVPNFYDRDVGRLLPLKHLLLETDAPYFVPKKLKDAENAPKIAVPGHVFHTAAQIAALRDLPVEDILISNRRNVAEIYGVPFEEIKEEFECNKDTSKQEDKKEWMQDTLNPGKAQNGTQQTIKSEITLNEEVTDMQNKGCIKSEIETAKPSLCDNGMKRQHEIDTADIDEKIGLYFRETKRSRQEVVNEVGKTHSESIRQQRVWKEISEKVKEEVSEMIIKSLFEDPYGSNNKYQTHVKRETGANIYSDTKEKINALQATLTTQSGARCNVVTSTDCSQMERSVQKSIKEEQGIHKEYAIQREQAALLDGKTFPQHGQVKQEKKDTVLTTKERLPVQDFKIPKLPSKYSPGKFTIPKKKSENKQNDNTMDKEKPKKSKEKEKSDSKKDQKEFNLWLEKKKSKAKHSGNGKIEYTPSEVLDLFFKWRLKHGEKSSKHEEGKNCRDDKKGNSNDKSSKSHGHDERKHKSKRHDHNNQKPKENSSSKSSEKDKKQKDAPGKN